MSKIKCIAITVKGGRCSWPHADDSKYCNYHINRPPMATTEDLKQIANRNEEMNGTTPSEEPVVPVNTVSEYVVTAIKCPNCSYLWEA